MGSASCKKTTPSEQNQQTTDKKNITIGVFGLHNAGKTSTVKAIEGEPTEDVEPTIGSKTTTVPHPIAAKNDKKNQERIKIIDLSGAERFREQSWPDYYDQIHGLIFVLDASEKKRINANCKILENLLEDDKLRDKPILIFANKQDLKGAINDGNNLKHKLDIEKLKTKHKLEFCTALPKENNKADPSIRDGFSWLIRTIDANYAELNSRVNNARQPKPVDRRTQITNKQKTEKSDRSDDDEDDGIVYTKKRTASPTMNKTKDYRSTNITTKLPSLDMNKNKPKTSDNGHETYDEDDDDDDDSRPGSRPFIPRINPDYNDRTRQLNQPVSSTTTTSGFNKKKKLVGAGNNNNDVSIKKSNDNGPKSFRSTYEPFPEEAPWSSSTNKTTKKDDLISKPYMKPPMINDFTKRNVSPLVNDTKPYSSGSISKRDNNSDDDDEFNRRQKAKPTLPSTNRFKDNNDSNKYGDLKYTSSLSTNKSSSTIKKPTSGVYGAGDDDDDDDYLKKPISKTNKSYGSDDDDNKNTNNKNNQRTLDRFNLNSDYRGITSKPPPSPSTAAATRSKFNEENFPSSLTKPIPRSKLNNDDYSSTLSKPITRSKFDAVELPSSLSKPITRPKYDDDDDFPAISKPITRSKYDTDSRSLSPSKPIVRPKYDEDDFPSSSKPINRFKIDDDDRPSPLSKPTTRSKFDDDDRPSSSLKPITRFKYDDDDDLPSTSKPINRSKFNDDDRSSSSSKPTARSKFEDDDFPSSSKPMNRSKFENDDRLSPLPKSTTRSKFDDDRSSSPLKPTTRFKYDDDDDLPSTPKPINRSKFDDDDRPSSSSKPTTRSKFDDDDFPSSSKAKNRSKFDDDDDLPSKPKPTNRSKFDDDDRSSPLSKPASRSKYDDDDFPSTSKPANRSKYDDDDDRSPSPIKSTSRPKYDDDDYPSSYSKRNNEADSYQSTALPKKTSYSSNYDDNNRSGGARSHFGNDDFDSPKGGVNSARAVSASPSRFRKNTDYDD